MYSVILRNEDGNRVQVWHNVYWDRALEILSDDSSIYLRMHPGWSVEIEMAL